MHRAVPRLRSFVALAAAIIVVFLEGTVPASDAPKATNRTAYEALQRLKGMDLEANPALKAAVVRVASSLRGTQEFVDVVRDFHLEDQDPGLIEVARLSPDSGAAAEAIRLLLRPEHVATLQAGIDTPGDSEREALTRAVANAMDPRAVPLLVALLASSDLTPALRTSAVQGLARTEAGAHELLRLHAEHRLDDTARTTAGLILSQARWPAIREQALNAFPPPQSGDGQPLPALTELVAMHGDARAGAALFRSEQVGCIKCHRVGDEGTEFGPALSQIGTKLGRQALYEAILDPSAGISFGYEGWTLETRDGEEVYGIITSETADEISVRQTTGVTVRVAKSAIASRTPQSLSVMPQGLAQAMTRQQLVDLVEYLTTLREDPPK